MWQNLSHHSISIHTQCGHNGDCPKRLIISNSASERGWNMSWLGLRIQKPTLAQRCLNIYPYAYMDGHKCFLCLIRWDDIYVYPRCCEVRPFSVLCGRNLIYEVSLVRGNVTNWTVLTLDSIVACMIELFDFWFRVTRTGKLKTAQSLCLITMYFVTVYCIPLFLHMAQPTCIHLIPAKHANPDDLFTKHIFITTSLSR